MAGAIVLAGCASAAEPTYPQLMADLCAKNAGWKIYKTADDVRGYFYAGSSWSGILADAGCPALNISNLCIDALVQKKFFYIESEVPNDPQVIKKHFMVDSPGLYRFTIEKRGHPNCRIFEELTSIYDLIPSGFKEFYSVYCIATEPIDEIISKYKIVDTYNQIYSDESGRIMENKTEISEIDSGNIIASERVYSFLSFSLPRKRIVSCPQKNEPSINGVRAVLRGPLREL